MESTHRVLVLAIIAALLAAAGCGVDYGILDGKQCDPAGGCASGYACDLASGRCVPEGETPGGSKDGGAAGDAGGSHADAGRDAGRDASIDTGVDDTGFDPDGALDGAVGAGADAAADAGHDASLDAGTDASFDAGHDSGLDAGTDAGFDAGCVPGCPAPGAVECRSDATYVTCIDPNRNGCLDWSAETACGPNEKCIGSACVCQPSCAGRCGGEDDGCGTQCPDTCNGHAASCVATVCTCASSFTGAYCDLCVQWFTNYPACTACGASAQPCCDAGDCLTGLACVAGVCRNACPGDMARVPGSAVCIDRYEVSKGSSNTARSETGYKPWVNIKRQDAENACLGVAKRMCRLGEWRAACRGLAGNAYPYGPNYVDNACNDDNSGQCQKDGSDVKNTGATATCEGGVPGVFDLSGNVWEWIWDVSNGKCALQGGSVDACGGGDAPLLSCNHDAWQDCNLTWPALGFRCCKDVP